jgi:osmoprotectant transport system ATP-binding protein
MIELQNVVKIYDGRRVIDSISFTVQRGQFCALIGPSGSGKSTALRMINRLIPMSGGTIRIAGEDIALVPAEALRRRIGYVIQSGGLFPHWTIEENVATVPRLLGWSKAATESRVLELLDLVQLDAQQYRGKYPHQLSGGQQQRVGVARALAANPDVLLMDEPFGALDPITREGLRAELVRIHRSTGVTVVFVTHDMDEALGLADVLAILQDGRLAQVGTPREILEQPASDFVRDFVGQSEIGLKLLAVRRVAERARHGELIEGEPIAAEASLRDAVSQMVIRQTDRLPVRDARGAVTGSVFLEDVVR